MHLMSKYKVILFQILRKLSIKNLKYTYYGTVLKSSQTPNPHRVEGTAACAASEQSAKPCACVMDVDTADPSTRMNAVGAAPRYLRVR